MNLPRPQISWSSVWREVARQLLAAGKLTGSEPGWRGTVIDARDIAVSLSTFGLGLAVGGALAAAERRGAMAAVAYAGLGMTKDGSFYELPPLEREADGDRRRRFCRCLVCRRVERCQPSFDFYTTPESQGYLVCETCFRGNVPQRVAEAAAKVVKA